MVEVVVLAVRTCHGNRKHAFADDTEYLRTFKKFKAAIPEKV